MFLVTLDVNPCRGWIESDKECRNMKAFVDQDTCIACGMCVSSCNEVYEFNDDGKAEAIVDLVPRNWRKTPDRRLITARSMPSASPNDGRKKAVEILNRGFHDFFML